MENLPQIHPSHVQEKISIQRLELALLKNLFILRSEDGGDYGVDRILEVIKDGYATNIRSHIQIKSKKSTTSKNNFLKFPVPVATLNYLLNSLNSIFIIYAEDKDQFYWDWIGSIGKEYKRKTQNLKKKDSKTFSYAFSSVLNEQTLKLIHEQLINDSTLVIKLNLTSNPFEKVIITESIHDKEYRKYLSLYADKKFELVIALAKEEKEPTAIVSSLISLCYYEIYNYDEALKYILKAEEIEANPRFKKIRVMILCEKGVKENSKIALQQAKDLFLSIKSSEWDWMDSYNYGNVLSGLTEYEESEKCYLHAIFLDPNQAIVWKNLSTVYKVQGKYDQELECLNTALKIDPNLIEALICKALLYGKRLLKFEEAIVYLEKALLISKSSMGNNSSIYYWKGEFLNSLGKYDLSISNINEGLTYHPGDKYLERIKLNTLILAAEKDKRFEEEAIKILNNTILRFPGDIRARVEIIKLLKRHKDKNEIASNIFEAFKIRGYQIDSKMIEDISIDEIVFILENIDSITEYRKASNISQLFFERYNVSIIKIKKIEMKANFLFAKFNSKMNHAKVDEIINLFEMQAQEIVLFGEYCTEILVCDKAKDSTEEKAKIVSEIVLTLPELLLIEFSRQKGWLIQFYNFPIELADNFIENSGIVKDWFNLCIEPILKGANSVLKWVKEEDN
jgi:tetratricopeptide (TPR) repeat protein